MRPTISRYPSSLASPGAARSAETRGLSQNMSGKDPGSPRSGLTAEALGRGRKWRGRLQRMRVTLIAAVIISTTAFAQKPADKPRVPPGVDPGGVAVAIIGSGVDYTRPEIAARLARDGEGEIIGWDFVDNDRRPYSTCYRPPRGRENCTPDHIQALMLSLHQRALPSRLIIVRVSTSAPQTLVQAMNLLAQLPARVVLFAGSEPPIPREFLHDAAKRFPKLLLVADPSMTTSRELGSQIIENLRIVEAGQTHVVEAASLLASNPDLVGSALNSAVFGGSSTPPNRLLQTLPGGPSASTKP